MRRLGLIAWVCSGALGLGLVLLEAARRKRPIRVSWSVIALSLGPIFLFLILPLWLGRWGRDDSNHELHK